MIRPNATLIQSLARQIVLAGALMTISTGASAQSASDLPMSTTGSINISGSQATQINDFVQAWAPKALSDNPQDIKKAIEVLIKPLNMGGVSVAFRQSYTQSLMPLLNELDAKNTVGAKLSSLRLAGDLATPGAVLRVKAAIGDEDLGVRLFAVSRAAQIFKTTQRSGPAMTPTDAASLIDALKALAGTGDINPELLSACIRALGVAATLSSKDMGDTRSKAIVALSDVVGARLRALNAKDDPSYVQELALHAASAATASISDISSQTTPEAVKAAVGLGGDIISISLRRVVGNTMEPVSRRDMTVRSMQAGESLLYFALRKDAELNSQSVGSVKPTDFADQLKNGKEKDFRIQAAGLLGPGSAIVTRFGFDDERFLR